MLLYAQEQEEWIHGDFNNDDNLETLSHKKLCFYAAKLQPQMSIFRECNCRKMALIL